MDDAVIAAHMDDLERRLPACGILRDSFGRAARLLAGCARADGRILVCGNGGSAADAEHIVGELMKRFLRPRPLGADFLRALEGLPAEEAAALSRLEAAIPAISLVSGVSLPTAFANDVAADLCFAQQVHALARPGDVVWGISTSGRSANVSLALRVARLHGCSTLGLTGRDGGPMAALLDVEIRVPANDTPAIQELHLPVYHALCACVEEMLF